MYKVLVVLFLSLVLTACGEQALIEGEQATVTKNTLVAIDTDTYEELEDMSGNNAGIVAMMEQGIVGTIDEGTEVTVVDPVAGYHMVQIRTLDGVEVIIDEDSLEQ